MKKTIIGGVFISLIEIFFPQFIQAQGSVAFLSNLGESSSGYFAVGSDSWLAEPFITGSNAGGYALNSVQLAMTDASGTPGGFTVMIYGEANNPAAILPGSSLDTLSGSTSPTSSGTYTYTPVSGVSLSPHSYYFIVLTSGTPVASGAYGWSVEDATRPASSGWLGFNLLQSSNGSSTSWNFISSSYPQFSLDATPTPEPGVLGLFALGGLLVASHRRKARPV